jgi:hypothetical protein
MAFFFDRFEECVPLGRQHFELSERGVGGARDTEPGRARSDALWHVRAEKEAPSANALEQRLANRRAPGCLWAKGGCRLETLGRFQRICVC